MNAPEDQNGLREALARAEAERDAAVAENERLRFEIEAIGQENDDLEQEAEEAEGLLQGIVAVTAARDAAEAEITRLKEGMEAALRPFAEAWDGVEAISEQGAGYVQDDSDAWVSGNASGGSYPLFKFGDLRRASDALATLSPKEHPHG